MSFERPSYQNLSEEAICGLEEAQSRYADAVRAWRREVKRADDYMGNNPNKFRGQIKEARIFVDRWGYIIKHYYNGELPEVGE